MPASRSARAITFAPRSWPSRPGLAMRTRIRLSGMGWCQRVGKHTSGLPQVYKEILEQAVEFVGVIHEKRVAVARKDFIACGRQLLVQVLKLGRENGSVGGADENGLRVLQQRGLVVCPVHAYEECHGRVGGRDVGSFHKT